MEQDTDEYYEYIDETIKKNTEDIAMLSTLLSNAVIRLGELESKVQYLDKKVKDQNSNVWE